MYEGNTAAVTHRIIEIQPGGYLTKGDANNTDDKVPIPPEKVIGKVILTIPGAGAVIQFFQSPMGMLLLTLTLFGMIALPGLTDRKNT